MGARRLGRYELLVRIASGGAANVFLVRDLESNPPGRLLALKVLLPNLAQNEEFLRMFFTEAKIASKLHHPNVVAIAGFGQVDGIHSLAMEYVFGVSLAQVLRASARAQRPLSVGVLLGLTASVCDALHYAHELVDDDDGEHLGLVHRDVTPQNILIGFNGQPKLTDFGIAKATGRGWETQAGIVKGKFSYMSPEQALGKRVDRRSDIFGTGIVLWEALTGHDLFRGATPMEVLAAIREQRIEPPSEVVPGLTSIVDPIVMKALERSPRKRYATSAEMGDDIRGLIRKAGVIIDAQAISREFAGVYGDVIVRRAFALRAAMAGQPDMEELARVLGAFPLDQRHLPKSDPTLQDPDPLGIQERSSQDLAPKPRPRPPLTQSFQQPWEDSTSMNVPDDELLSMLSADDATVGHLPPKFAERFGEALETSQSGEPEVPSFDTEATMGAMDGPKPRSLTWSLGDSPSSESAVSASAVSTSAVSDWDRPVPRAPSLDMDAEPTPAPSLSDTPPPSLDLDENASPLIRLPGTRRVTSRFQLPDDPNSDTGDVDPSAYGLTGFDDDMDGAQTALGPAVPSTDLDAAPLDDPDVDVGLDPEPSSPVGRGSVELSFGTLLATATLLLGVGVAIGFLLFRN